MKTNAMFERPFSFKGRIRRTEYVMSTVIFVITFLFILVTSQLFKGGEFLFLGMIPLLWFIYAQGVKRCHDFGKSDSYLLLPYCHVRMIISEGDKGVNKFGPNPKESL